MSEGFHRVESDDDKYFHVVKNLTHDVLLKIDNFLESLPVDNKYLTLQQALLERYTEKEENKLDKFLNNAVMGPRTPSEFLEFLTATGANIFPRDSILKIWYERLPSYISVLLDSEVNSLNEVESVKKADKIYTKFSKDKNSINAFSSNSEIESSENTVSNKLELLDQKLEKFCNTITNNYRSIYDQYKNKDKFHKNQEHSNKHRNNSKDRYFRSPDRGRLSSKSRSPSRERSFCRERFSSRDRSSSRNSRSNPKGELCYYHHTYRHKAHKCIEPCRWHDRKLEYTI